MSYFSFLKQINFFQRPAPTINQEKQETTKIKQSNSAKQNDSFSVLIADKKENTRQQIESQLKHSVNIIALADDEIIAHTLLLLNSYDLIFLNPNLQSDNKDTLIDIIRQEISLNTNTPIIAITDTRDKQQRKKLITLGFDDCLDTPISKNQISEILSLWLPTSNTPYQAGNINEINYVNAMLRRTQGDKEMANTVFNKLFIELPQQIQSIEKALAFGHLKAARDTVHMLHGSIISCGFSDIQEIVQPLEISLEQEYLEEIETNFNALKDKISHFIHLKETIVNQLAL